jgi:hypothetical protein
MDILELWSVLLDSASLSHLMVTVVLVAHLCIALGAYLCCLPCCLMAVMLLQ